MFPIWLISIILVRNIIDTQFLFNFSWTIPLYPEVDPSVARSHPWLPQPFTTCGHLWFNNPGIFWDGQFVYVHSGGSVSGLQDPLPPSHLPFVPNPPPPFPSCQSCCLAGWENREKCKIRGNQRINCSAVFCSGRDIKCSTVFK